MTKMAMTVNRDNINYDDNAMTMPMAMAMTMMMPMTMTKAMATVMTTGWMAGCNKGW